jgi:hypothetical protein
MDEDSISSSHFFSVNRGFAKNDINALKGVTSRKGKNRTLRSCYEIT